MGCYRMNLLHSGASLKENYQDHRFKTFWKKEFFNVEYTKLKVRSQTNNKLNLAVYLSSFYMNKCKCAILYIYIYHIYKMLCNLVSLTALNMIHDKNLNGIMWSNSTRVVFIALRTPAQLPHILNKLVSVCIS